MVDVELEGRTYPARFKANRAVAALKGNVAVTQLAHSVINGLFCNPMAAGDVGTDLPLRCQRKG
jgi:hypothetical protein